MKSHEEFERTIIFAEGAIDHIRGDRVPAYPKTYEVWYAYVTGENPELIQAIDDIHGKYGRVSSAQILQLHETYINRTQPNDKADRISDQITNEVGTLEEIIQRSFGVSHQFGTTLKQAAADLELPLDHAALNTLIKRMTMETAHIQNENASLLTELQNARKDLIQLRKNLEEVREETIMDQLTMIGNRRHFDRSLENNIENHKLSKQPLCLILADIDHFKLFNDQWGHQTGDQVLRLVALAIKGNVKTTDIPCRYGGEEFAVILPNTSLAQGLAVAERIRKTVAKRDVVKRSTGENLGQITISAGIAMLHPKDSVQSLIHRTDRCLYAAKNAGRNQCVTERDKMMIKAA